jgi:hypothetical protein
MLRCLILRTNNEYSRGKQEIGQAVWFNVKHLHFIQGMQGVSIVLGPGYFEDFGDFRFRYNKSS